MDKLQEILEQKHAKWDGKTTKEEDFAYLEREKDRISKESLEKIVKAMSREELLEFILSKKDRIDEKHIKDVVHKSYQEEYRKAKEKYLESISDTVEVLEGLCEAFKDGRYGWGVRSGDSIEETAEKDKALTQIVELLDADKRMLISRELSYRITGPTLYALQKKDLHASALLLERRKRLQKDSDTHMPPVCRSADAIDRMDLMDKFVALIAEKCDDQTAEKYVKDMYKYVDNLRVFGGQYTYVGEAYAREMLKEEQTKLQGKKVKKAKERTL